jgi:hypothetical protein
LQDYDEASKIELLGSSVVIVLPLDAFLPHRALMGRQHPGVTRQRRDCWEGASRRFLEMYVPTLGALQTPCDELSTE